MKMTERRTKNFASHIVCDSLFCCLVGLVAVVASLLVVWLLPFLPFFYLPFPYLIPGRTAKQKLGWRP